MGSAWQLLLRVLRHRRFGLGQARRALPQPVLAQLQAQVQASELRHSGQIRIYIESGLPNSYLWRGASARERAITLFGKLRVWDTEHNNGVLIYLLLADRAIELVADRGLCARVPESHWQQLLEQLRMSLRQGQYHVGLEQALDELTALLVQHYPADASTSKRNELPDAPVLR